MRCAIIFKCMAAIFMITGCGDIPRDNVLDPKNPDSYRRPLILIEAFVNSAHPTDYNREAIMALQNIQKEYSDPVLISVYHRNLEIDGQKFTDSLYVNGTTSERATELQNTYLQEWPGSTRGVPDIYINGANHRIAGASARENVMQRLRQNIDVLLTQKSYYTLTAETRYSEKNEIIMDCRIAPLANQKGENLQLRVAFIKDVDAQEGRDAVIGLYDAIDVKDIKAGEYREITLGPFSLWQQPQRVIITLTSEDRKQVFQSIREDI
ncbi:MAG: hypothetical protein GF313_03390 [Caldithrix sp.]|nr:hypothetical protein [Caldithrix sp.]